MSNTHSFLRKNILFHRFFFSVRRSNLSNGSGFSCFSISRGHHGRPKRSHTIYDPFYSEYPEQANPQRPMQRCRSGWFPEPVGKGSMKARLLMGLRSSHRATGTFRIRYRCWLYTSMNDLKATKSHAKWLFLSFANFAG